MSHTKGQIFSSGAPYPQRPRSWKGVHEVGLSGSPMSSGRGASGVFMLGEALDQDAPVAYQLAPRMYQLVLADLARPASGEAAAAFADLPLHLLFGVTIPGEAPQQHWFSEETSRWKWQLSSESRESALLVQLTAAPRHEQGAARLLWRATDPWQPFGSNVLRAQGAGNEVPTLIVRAP